MNRYTAPLGFALVAIWVAVIFALVGGQSGSASTHHATSTSQVSRPSR
jgi:hypothetical protein